MSRFSDEWNGKLGPYWQQHAHEEAERLLQKQNEIIVEEDGAAKWASNGNYLPDDVVEKLLFAGATFFSPEATAAKREEQEVQWLAEYRKAMQNHVPSAEERYEMEAAFGKGAKVVNVITGEEMEL